MAAFDRCERCVRKANAWYGKDFNVVCELSRQPAQAPEFKAAEANLVIVEGGGEPPFPVPMGVTASKRTGYRMESTYSFVTISQFTKRFKYQPKSLGMKVETDSRSRSVDLSTGICIEVAGIPSPPTSFNVL
jgi:hypothetical protein